MNARQLLPVMPGLVAGIHVFGCIVSKAWMAGTSPAMTTFLVAATGKR
jgi:hypothetical protein